MFHNRKSNKENVEYLHTQQNITQSFKKKKEIMKVAGKQKETEKKIILDKVSQTHKDKYGT